MKILYTESCSKHAMQNSPEGRGHNIFAAASTCMNTPAHSRYDSSDSAMELSICFGMVNSTSAEQSRTATLGHCKISCFEQGQVIECLVPEIQCRSALVWLYPRQQSMDALLQQAV